MPKKSLDTLTEPMYYVLLSLINEMCGTDIMKSVEKISDNRVHIGPGTLYTMLSKFLDSGLIENCENIENKKNYKITEKGIKLLKEEHSRLYQSYTDGVSILEGLKWKQSIYWRMFFT